MEKLIALGTGYAFATKCYNTCFAITDDESGEYFLVDAGGGNGIIRQCEKAGIRMDKIHHVFFTHRHPDHLLGAVWLVRKIGTMMLAGRYEGDLSIYSHGELVEIIRNLCGYTLQKNLMDLFGKRIFLIAVNDGEEKQILGHGLTFFDIHSTKAKQFGFIAQLQNGRRLTCLGDEPFSESSFPYASSADWMLCEAFCLYGQQDIYKPYEKHHSTVKDACELAQRLSVKNLVLWHTEDDNLLKRKELYMEEGKRFFAGRLFVPDDLEWIEL